MAAKQIKLEETAEELMTYSDDDLYNINSWGADLSFREIITMYEEGELLKPELQRKYAALANEMAKEYIPEYLEGHQYSWIIPNNSDEMTITIKCNCEIPELEGIA